MNTHRILGALLVSALSGVSALGETRPVDKERSTLTVHVYKAGLLSAFGDNHVVRAPISSGTVNDGSAPEVQIAVDARQMTVLDPDLAPKKRDEVQRRMLGPEVLDVAKFEEIRFRSTAVQQLSTGRWRVSGVLELHGKSVPLSFEATGGDGQVKGSATFSQRAFGIEPISVAGGTVKVKDQVRVDFDVSTAAKR